MTAEIRVVILCDAPGCQEQVTSPVKNIEAVRAAARERLHWGTDGESLDYCPLHRVNYRRLKY